MLLNTSHELIILQAVTGVVLIFLNVIEFFNS
jgi:hypothetical protein